MARRLISFGVGLALMGMAQAQLPDPTRPPANLMVTNAGAPESAPPAALTLQSVILRKGGKPAALINGEFVELGGKVGEARLVKIREDRVVLRGPLGEETLRLTPAAEKKPVAPAGKAKKESKR
ncbi:MAG: hypothetical protein N3C63_02400 [Rhodocyclaceae bacterium]|nr:hypothetical protein [Rhodocyclaceae bacterium]